MNYVILEKAKPYTRIRRGKSERVKGYTGRPRLVFHGTMIEMAKKKILKEGLIPGGFFKKVFATTNFYSAATYALNDGDFRKDGSNGGMVFVDETAFSKNDSGILTSKQKISPDKIIKVAIYDPKDLEKYCKLVISSRDKGFDEDGIQLPKPLKVFRRKPGKCYYVFVRI